MNEQDRQREEALRQANSEARSRAEESRRLEEQRREEERRRAENQRRQDEERRRQEQERRQEDRATAEQSQRDEQQRQSRKNQPDGQGAERSPEQSRERTPESQQLGDLGNTQDKYVRLIKSGYYDEKRAESPEGQAKESPAMERLKAKMEGMKEKIQEHINEKSHDLGRDR